MVLEGVSVGKSPVTGVTLVRLILASGSQQSVILLLADHPHYLAVGSGKSDCFSLNNLFHLLDMLKIYI